MTITIGTCLRLKHKSYPTFSYLHQKRFRSLLSEDHRLISILKSCSQNFELSQIHCCLIKSGLGRLPFPLSKLLASSVLVDIEYAASIFKHIHNPNLFMFNTMLRGYSIGNDPKQALVLFNNLRSHAHSFSLDQFSFVSTLKSCSRLCDARNGRGIHSIVIRSGHVLFLNVKNTLLHYYGVCGEIACAHQLFDECSQRRDLVTWNTLMAGYLHASQPAVVVDLFKQLRGDGMRIGVSTILSALSAIGHLGDVTGGESLHGYCIKAGFYLILNVVTALIAMYGNIGYIDSRQRVFNEVPVKDDIVLWNCLIDGYAQNGLLDESLALLQLMKLEQLKPNSSTLSGLLSACAATGALALGQRIHEYVEEEQLVLDHVLGTALVDMYCKCGSLEKAIDVFDRMESKDVKSWTAMISGLGAHGRAKIAIAIFRRMEEEGFGPNEVTFLAVLSACSHGGLVSEGMSYLDRMVREYGLTPKVEHYGCIIDLLGRAGLLEEAHKMIKSLPIKGDATAWRALLAACRVHGNVNLGECVKKVLEEICGLQHPADLIVLSSAYAIAGRLPRSPSTGMMEGGNMRTGAESMPVGRKEAGLSSIELDGWR
ncbi:hypothetical protein NMG60_11009200 [Bertholletia excelsa]